MTKADTGSFTSSAQRLYRLFDAARHPNTSDNRISGWSRVLKAIGHLPEDYSPSAVDVALILIATKAELDRMRADAIRLDLWSDPIEIAYQNLDSAIRIDSLGSKWDEVQRTINQPESPPIHWLKHLKQKMPAVEPAITEEEINALRETTAQLVASAKLHPGPVGDFLNRLAAEIQRALASYAILGHRAFSDALSDIAGMDIPPIPDDPPSPDGEKGAGQPPSPRGLIRRTVLQLLAVGRKARPVVRAIVFMVNLTDATTSLYERFFDDDDSVTQMMFPQPEPPQLVDCHN